MTHFEYIAAVHTLILTFAAARILAGVSNAMRPGRLYWVHLSWTLLAVMYCLTSFWVFWGYRDIEWTLPLLILLLAAPGVIYVFSSTLVPADSSEVDSWREYFFSVRPRLFATGFVMMLTIVASNQVLAGAPPMHASQIPLYGMLVVFAVGAASASPRLHDALAVVPPLNVVGIVLVLSRPDWNAP